MSLYTKQQFVWGKMKLWSVLPPHSWTILPHCPVLTCHRMTDIIIKPDKFKTTRRIAYGITLKNMKSNILTP